MTKEREGEIRCGHVDHRLGPWGHAALGELLAEIDRLRHALYCIKVEYAYCTQCSASALAEQALEQKP